MRKNVKTLIFIIAMALVVCTLNASVPADMAKEVYIPFDPNKKKAGEECKSSDECQKHHECTNNGKKNVCTAPPPQTLPPGAVT